MRLTVGVNFSKVHKNATMPSGFVGGATMAMIRSVVLALTVLLPCALGMAGPALAGSCDICDCNDQRSLCRMQCQQRSSDYSARLTCETTCAKKYASCVDTAYKTSQSLSQSAQQAKSTSTTTTATGSTASGS